MKISVSKSRNSWVIWLLVLLLAGYPLAAVLVSYFGLETRTITIPYRFAVFSLSVAILLSGFLFPLRGKPSLIILAFFGLYAIRLIYDAYIADNEFAPDALQFFVVATMIPTIAILFALDDTFDERTFSRRLLFVTAISVLSYYTLLYTGRVTIEIGNRASLIALNPVSFGHLASTGVIAAVFVASSERNFLWSAVAILAGVVAVPILFFAGSRGPMVALAAALLWLATTNKKRAMLLIPVLAAAAVFIPEDNLLIERFMGIFNGLDRSSIARLEIQMSALADFLENPFLGKHFMDASFGEGSWPHNYFLESAMAMGIPGLILSIILVFGAFRAAISSVNRKNPLLVALLVQALVAAQFSGSLFGATKLFGLFAAVLALGKLHKRRSWNYRSIRSAPLPEPA